MSPTRGHRPEPGSEIGEGRIDLARERVLQDLPMLGFGRPAMPRCPRLQTVDDLVVEVPDVQ